jgi:hypothetical protein
MLTPDDADCRDFSQSGGIRTSIVASLKVKS